jgi:hypothetical protein
VFAAYQGSFFVDPAKVVLCKITTFILYLKIPFPIFNKYYGAFMGQEPAYILEILLFSRGIYLESEISAALRFTFTARHGYLCPFI